MPIYEYRCRDCGTKSTFVTLSVGAALDPKCRRCGGTNLEKLVSRVAVLRSEDSRLENMADPSKLGGIDENDPASVARWMRKTGKEMGEDLGEDFERQVEEAAEGGEPGGGGTGEDDGGLD
jgi:putative FmdB family regulatory protein